MDIMQNLIVDMGNTLVKIAIFEGGYLVEEYSFEVLTVGDVEDILSRFPVVKRAIISSTRARVGDVVELLKARLEYCIEFTPEVAVPIECDYLTPQTLGRDRLAAAVGSVVLYPNRNVMIADFGTAITIDLVNEQGCYKGGAISPGMLTRFRSLHDYTSSLPMCGASDEIILSGLTTKQAIEAGVMNGISFEIEGYICELSKKNNNLLIIFTGGDNKYFVKRIKNAIFANRNLIFCGLNRILEYNAGEKYYY